MWYPGVRELKSEQMQGNQNARKGERDPDNMGK